MTTERAIVKRNWTWIWPLLGVLLSIYIFEQDVEYQLLEMGMLPQAGTLAVHTEPAPQFGQRRLMVTAIDPGSPLATAGVISGDQLRYDHPIDYGRIFRRGEPVGFMQTHKGHSMHKIVVAASRPPADARSIFYETSFNLADVISLLIGVVILVRSGGRSSTMALGGALISFGITVLWPQFLESDPRVVVGFAAFNYGSSVIEATLFVAFAMLYYRDNGGRVPAVMWWGLAGYFTVALVWQEVMAWCEMTAWRIPLFGNGAAVQGFLDSAGLMVTLGYLIAGWRRSSHDARRRYTLLLVAISAIIGAQIVQIALSNLLDGYRRTPWILVYSVLSGVVAPVLFAYAILRHKVLDLGFAINRTLVYGVVSLVLLVGFGLVEWASEKFIPIESKEKNLFIDAAIALGIFLVFHRVRDFAERIIEDIFFRSWRDKEKELRTFVAQSGFILRRGALVSAIVKAVERYAGGAPVAVYIPDEALDFRLAEGKAGAVGDWFDADDQALVTLRATLKPIETHEGTLVLPMVHRNALSGVVVVGHKQSGDAWRPDEVETLSWAVLQVGHDLHALKIEQLEADAVALRQQNTILLAQLEIAKARA